MEYPAPPFCRANFHLVALGGHRVCDDLSRRANEVDARYRRMTPDNPASKRLRERRIQRPDLRVRNEVGGGAVEICEIAIEVRRGRIRDEAGLVAEFGRALPEGAHAGPNGRSDHWNQKEPDCNGQLAL